MNYNDMWLCHTKDYDIQVEVDFYKKKYYIIKKEDLDPKRFVMQYGKYQGKNLADISGYDSSYIDWLKDNDNDLLLQQCIINL